METTQTSNVPITGNSSQTLEKAASPSTSLARKLSEEFDRFFEGFGTRPNWLSPFFGRDPIRKRIEELGNMGVFLPDVDVLRNDSSFIVRADLPGIPKENVHVEVKDGTLVIRGERSRNEGEEREVYYRSERSYGSFFRSIPLPRDVSGENASATFKDGVLEVVIPAPKVESNGKEVKID